jgi:hypothetical protein
VHFGPLPADELQGYAQDLNMTQEQQQFFGRFRKSSGCSAGQAAATAWWILPPESALSRRLPPGFVVFQVGCQAGLGARHAVSLTEATGFASCICAQLLIHAGGAGTPLSQ